MPRCPGLHGKPAEKWQGTDPQSRRRRVETIDQGRKAHSGQSARTMASERRVGGKERSLGSVIRACALLDHSTFVANYSDAVAAVEHHGMDWSNAGASSGSPTQRAALKMASGYVKRNRPASRQVHNSSRPAPLWAKLRSPMTVPCASLEAADERIISDRAANFRAAPAFPNTFAFRRFAVFNRESRYVQVQHIMADGGSVRGARESNCWFDRLGRGQSILD